MNMPFCSFILELCAVERMNISRSAACEAHPSQDIITDKDGCTVEQNMSLN